MGTSSEAELPEGRVELVETHPQHREEVKAREGQEGMVLLSEDDECLVSFLYADQGPSKSVWINARWLESIDEPEGERAIFDNGEDIEDGCYRIQQEPQGGRKYAKIDGESCFLLHYGYGRTETVDVRYLRTFVRGKWTAYRVPCEATPLADAVTSKEEA